MSVKCKRKKCFNFPFALSEMWLQTACDWALAELASGNLLLLRSSPPEQPYHGNTELESSLLQWTLTCRNVDRNAWNHVSEVSSENHCGHALSASIGRKLADACLSGWCNLGEDSCPALQGSSPELGCLPVWAIAKLEGKLHICWSLWVFFFPPFSLTLTSQVYKLAELHFLTDRALPQSRLSAGVWIAVLLKHCDSTKYAQVAS